MGFLSHFVFHMAAYQWIEVSASDIVQLDQYESGVSDLSDAHLFFDAHLFLESRR